MNRSRLSADAALTADPRLYRPCRRCKCTRERHMHYSYNDYCGTCGMGICPSYQAPLSPLAAWVLKILRRTR